MLLLVLLRIGIYRLLINHLRYNLLLILDIVNWLNYWLSNYHTWHHESAHMLVILWHHIWTRYIANTHKCTLHTPHHRINYRTCSKLHVLVSRESLYLFLS